MSMSQDQLDEFYRFATARIRSGETGMTMYALLSEWHSKRNRDEINAAIREGLADIEAGRTRPAAEVTEELRRKYNVQE